MLIGCCLDCASWLGVSGFGLPVYCSVMICCLVAAMWFVLVFV